MLGSSKESTTITSGERVVAVLNQQQVPETESLVIPDVIEPMLEQAGQSFEEYQQLVSIKKARRLPRGQRTVYRDRIRQIEAELEGASKIISAIEAGYEPYTVPKNFYAGLVAACRPWQNPNGIRLQFNAPMPKEVLDKYETAKKSKLFDTFLVVSPDRELFTQISTLNVEPFLVGYVKTVTEGVRFDQGVFTSPELKVTGGVGFLITHWDLQKDLQFNSQS